MATTSVRPSPGQVSHLAMFPDEILIRIFHQVDSVNRKRAERACRRWMSLLRQTTSLRQHLVIDMNHLATPHSASSEHRRDLESNLLRRTLSALVSKDLPITMLRVTGESNPTKPWLSQSETPYKFPADILRSSLKNLFNEDTGVSTLVLQKVVLTDFAIWSFFGEKFLLATQLRCVLFDDVNVQNEVSRSHKIVRRITGQVMFGNEAIPLDTQVFTLLGSIRPPLQAVSRKRVGML